MSKDQLVQHIYTNLLPEFPDLAQNQSQQRTLIANFIDAFLTMYPAHEAEITPEETHQYQYREIALFAIAEFTQFYSKRQSEPFPISQSVSRFLFARHASLVALRSRMSVNQLYPIHHLDTRMFSLNDHKALLQKLTFCHVSSLSLWMVKAPIPMVMDCYVHALHADKVEQKINPTIKKIEFLAYNVIAKTFISFSNS